VWVNSLVRVAFVQSRTGLLSTAYSLVDMLTDMLTATSKELSKARERFREIPNANNRMQTFEVGVTFRVMPSVMYP
jgi:hypothetical protein